VLDVDGFKFVNDSLGHQAGDELIRTVARTLAGRLRASDAIARLGGDEFAVLLRGAGAEVADAVAGELIGTLREARAEAGEKTIRVTASGGIAALDDPTTAESVLAAADMAMYEAKRSGRDRVVRFTDRLRGELERGRSWVARLRDALEQDRFVLLAQPVLGPALGRGRAARAAAARARRRRRAVRTGGVHGRRRALRPGRGDRPLGPAARARAPAHAGRRRAVPGRQRLGALDRPGRDRAARAGDRGARAARRRAAGADRRGHRERRDRRPRAGARVRRGAAAARPADVARRLRGRAGLLLLAARAAGRLPQDRRPVRRGLVSNAVDREIVKAIVALARAAGRRTVAEFVPDQDTLELLAELGVDLAQGFHVGRPRPLEEL
jgi:diguanylate cyclase (GGDEF)-like protein